MNVEVSQHRGHDIERVRDNNQWFAFADRHPHLEEDVRIAVWSLSEEGQQAGGCLSDESRDRPGKAAEQGEALAIHDSDAPEIGGYLFHEAKEGLCSIVGELVGNEDSALFQECVSPCPLSI